MAEGRSCTPLCAPGQHASLPAPACFPAPTCCGLPCLVQEWQGHVLCLRADGQREDLHYAATADAGGAGHLQGAGAARVRRPDPARQVGWVGDGVGGRVQGCGWATPGIRRPKCCGQRLTDCAGLHVWWKQQLRACCTGLVGGCRALPEYQAIRLRATWGSAPRGVGTCTRLELSQVPCCHTASETKPLSGRSAPLPRCYKICGWQDF